MKMVKIVKKVVRMSKSLIISKMIEQLDATFQLMNLVGNALIVATLIFLVIMICRMVTHKSWLGWLFSSVLAFGIVIAMCVNILHTGDSIKTTIKNDYSANATLKLVENDNTTYVFNNDQIKDKIGNYQYIGSLNHNHEWSDNEDGNKLYVNHSQLQSAKTVNARTYLMQVVDRTEHIDD